MKTRNLFQILSIGISALLLTACINGTPGSSGNSAVNKNTPAVNVPTADPNTPQPSAATQETSVYPTTPNPVVNVYLEISGSMNGYVNGGTSTFQQVVKEYLSGINNAGFASAVNYFYVGSRITPKGNDLNNYITKLTPSSFGAAGGGATTDIGGLFKTILGNMDSNTVSIFISDCIISPGSNTNTAAYARGQMTDVRDAIVSYTNQYEDLACLVYQFDSEFNGRYFDYQNHPRKVNMQRPFYIWVFGHTAHVAMMKLQYVPDKDFKVAPIRNQWIIFNTPLSALQENNKYGLLLPNTAKNGQYVRKSGTELRTIQKAGENYRFSFGANLLTAQFLMGDDYIEDTRNYKQMIGKAVKEKFYGEIEKDFNQSSPFSEIFRVDSDSPFQKGTFSLAFIPEVPDWAYECTDTDDRMFNGANDNKTYGLNNIFEGVFNGFNNGGHINILAQFDFEIK
jgi:hypothetical protein